jgi:hypothetical protein
MLGITRRVTRSLPWRIPYPTGSLMLRRPQPTARAPSYLNIIMSPHVPPPASCSAQVNGIVALTRRELNIFRAPPCEEKLLGVPNSLWRKLSFSLRYSSLAND